MQKRKGWTLSEVITPELVRALENIAEIAVLERTQFSKEADCPYSPEDIMCCGKFRRCHLREATRTIHREQEHLDVQDYHVIILEGEELERLVA